MIWFTKLTNKWSKITNVQA